MAKTISSGRYSGFFGLLLLITVLSSLVTTLACAFAHVPPRSERHEWSQQNVTNDFYRQLAGKDLLHADQAMEYTSPLLAADLRTWVADTPKEDLSTRLAAFTTNGTASQPSAYCNYDGLDVPDVLGNAFTGSCFDDQHLNPIFAERVEDALQGSLDGLVADNPRPASFDQPFWFSGTTMVIIGLLTGLVGFLVAAGVDRYDRTLKGSAQHGEPALDWALDGNNTTMKVLCALLNPHLVGVLVVRATLKTKGRTRSGKDPATSLEEAKGILASLETLQPRTETVEAATMEARRVVAELTNTLASSEADSEAQRLLEEVSSVCADAYSGVDARREVRRLR